MSEESHPPDDAHREGAYQASREQKRRNLITALALVLFFVAMITAAALGPDFFQSP